MSHFRHFAVIDWSGARGERLKGIAVALCAQGDGAPELVPDAQHRWSRAEVLNWLLQGLPNDTLVGLDLGISLPFADRGAFFPDWPGTPRTARELWQLVDDICAPDPHLGTSSFVDHAELCAYFRRHGGREGRHFGGGRGRFRLTEAAQQRAGCNPYSNFNLIGAAQVGKSSLSGMRMLHRLTGKLPIWPIDDLPAQGSAVVEIYTSIAARAAGIRKGKSKIASIEHLDLCLASLGSAPTGGTGPITDHQSDALLTAAWLRRAAQRAELWNPPGLEQVRYTEGWTFGAP